MNVRSFSKRAIALLLSLVLLTGMLPVSALATETEPTVATTTEATEPSTEATESTTEATEPSTEATEPEVIAVTGITLDQTALEVGVGELPITLTATVTPEDATDKTVTWTSSEPGVASVENGVLTFGYMGEAVITATAGEFTATCTVTVGEGEWDTYEGGIVVIAASDYQLSNSSTIMTNIMNQIKEDYGTPYAALLGGDYDAGDVNTTANHIRDVDDVISSVFPNLSSDNRIYIQGNHENFAGLKVDGTNLMDTTGEHDTDYYGVYVINHDDFPWSTSSNPKSSQKLVQATADALGTYLDTKMAAGYSEPIFVISHLPLHATTRGDNYYAKLIFDELEAAGEAGLNIIFLCGHNHSGGYDQYLGNGSFYLPVGSSLTVVNGTNSSYTDDSISFTYMNGGYLGKISGSACTHQTMSVFEITDSQVIVKRYAADGEHVLKAEGVASGSYAANTNEIGTEGAIIELGEPEEKVTVENDDKTVSVTAPGLTGLTVEKKFGTNDENANFDTSAYSAYASYDITPAGYEQGKTATVTITLDAADGFDASRKVVVIDVEEGTEVEKSIVDGTVTFTTNHFSTYNVGQEAVAASTGFTYELVTSIEAGEKYVIVGNDDLAVLMDNSGSMGTQTDGLTLNGTTLTSETALTEWTISSTSGGTIVSDTGNNLCYTNSAWDLGSTETLFDISADDSSFMLKMQRSHGSRYNFYYDGTDWSDKSTSNNYVRLFKLTSEGSGSTGGGTVDTEGGDWVTISSGVGGTVYKLDTDGVTTDENYLIVGTGADGTAYALRNNNGTPESAEVTISNGQIVTSETDIVWTYDSSKYLTNGNHSFYLSYNNTNSFLSTSDQRAMEISRYSAGGDGAYSVKREGSNYSYYLNYSGSNGWTNSGMNGSAQAIYFFVESGTEAAGDAEYAKMVEADGTTDFTFTVARGTNSTDALAAVKAGIDVLTSANADGSDPTTLEDTNTNITWTLDSSYDGTVPGEYAVKVYYKDKLLGTAKVIVPEATIMGYSADESGAVNKGASQKAETGAYITVYVKDDEGEDFTVPVTVGMLTNADGTKVSTATVGTYTGLTLTYNGTVITDNFTLTVNPKSGNNYPNYPDPGAVKVNKTATGIDFQASGVATVELSASGIPMNEGVDVVIILDTSNSMQQQQFANENGENVYRIDLLRPAVNNLISQLKTKREDGSDPDIDIAIATFNGNTIKEKTNYIGGTGSRGTNYGIKTGDGTIAGAWEDINEISATWATDNNNENTELGSGTNYDYGLQIAYDLLAQKKTDSGGERQQFVLFLSDGAPSQYNGVESNDGQEEYVNWLRANYDETDDDTSNDIPSTVTEKNQAFYTGYNNNNGQTHRSAEALKAAPGESCSIIRFDTDSTGQLEEVEGLGATVYSIGLFLEDYVLNGTTYRLEEDLTTVLKTIASDESKFFNIDSVNDLSGAFTTFAQDVLLAATDATFADAMGAAYDLQLTPVDYLPTGETETYSTITPSIEVRSYEIYTRAEYEAGDFTYENQIGTRKTNADGSYIYTTLETITFQYAKNGTNDYTLTGATSDQLTDTNILVDGVVCGKYVYYNTTSETKTVTVNGKEVSIAAESFYWVIGDIKTTELALRYNVYLTNSLQGGVTEGSYDTNGKAILSYTNYLGNACTKEAVSPTMAWKGALVRYAFYLVDASSGKPVNNDGTEVPFSNRTVIVDPTFYANVNLFSSDDVESMSIAAQGVIPAGYWLYDESAAYAVTVRGNGTGYWKITGDATLNNPNSTYVTGFDGDNYTNVDSDSASYDYTHTTVWFAVKWEPQAVPDTIVIDYGLPVDIHVLTNDMFGKYGKLVGIQAGVVAQPENNTGTCPITAASAEGSFGTAVINAPETGYTEANSVIRYTPNTMEITGSDQFTYAVQYDNPVANDSNGYYYGTLTIIPATTIYYEDEFVDLSSYTWNYDTNAWAKKDESGWTVVTDDTYVEGEDITQAEDRPDDVNYAFDTVIDANNIYGYDAAYDECSQYSLGSAVKAHVDYDNYAEASFSFYGTGFDVVSLSSSQTGAIYVEVDDANGNRVRDLAVDTYYGMTEDGELVANDPSALYQVPVIEVSGLTYGKYTVTIKAVYNEIFDHEQYSDNTYDFYLDAIRIYDPAGTPEDDTIEDAYKADEEGWPVYEEVRDNVISAAELEGSTELPGIVFIDSVDKVASVADYMDLGPNNELYLAANQAIAFQLDLSGYDVASVHLGIKSAAGDTVSYKVFNGTENLDKDAIAALPANTIETSTGMYYDITSLKDGVIVIYNAGTGMLSVTDIKITFNADPGVVENLFYTSAATINKLVENMNKTPEEEVTAPETFEVTAPETTVVGSRITVKVTTSADVDAVSIDGTMVTRYSTDANGNRVWTARVSASESGTKGIVVNTYNSDGYQSATKTASVTVNSAEETVETIIRKIADLFKGWFGW